METQKTPKLQILIKLNREKIIEEQIKQYFSENKDKENYEFTFSNLPKEVCITLTHKKISELLEVKKPKKLTLKSFKRKAEKIDFQDYLERFYNDQLPQDKKAATGICTVLKRYQHAFNSKGATGHLTNHIIEKKDDSGTIKTLYDLLLSIGTNLWKFRNAGEKGRRLFEDYLSNDGFYFLEN